MTRHSGAARVLDATRKVLVVEDNPVNWKVAVAMLGTLGYRAEVASHGLQALAAVDREDFSLVLMDCQMPEMDGFEATARIRARGDHKGRVPIIALTANALDGDRERCLGAGMDDYLAKPVKLDDLRHAMEAWLP